MISTIEFHIVITYTNRYFGKKILKGLTKLELTKLISYFKF
jgi:hypothetical protein